MLSPMRLILFALLLTTTAHAQWDIQHSGTTADLRGIASVGAGIAWASGSNGTVLRTEDSGYLWQRCTVPPGADKLDFRGIQAFDANTAIVMSSGKGDLSRLYKTTDGCQTWKLVFTNPDKDGFWDALSFHMGRPVLAGSQTSKNLNGYLVGDPVGGNFVIYRTIDSGTTWTRWHDDNNERPATAQPGEDLFAASNTSLVTPGYNGPFTFVTGGASGSELFMAQPHSPLDAGYWLAFSKIILPFKRDESAGAFSIASRFPASSPFPDFMIVGGDYKHPEIGSESAFYVPAPRHPFSKRIYTATTPPHGYRSAVAYDAATNTWITVGPNGTDISTDDGRNWRALKPTATEPPDADQHWNALSLPFVVGPHGRIGVLNPAALKSPSK
jgi:hypothetical protein